MHLREHLTETATPFGQFAGRIGVSRQTLRLYLIGERFPRPMILRRIHDATNGAVTANDFLDARESATAGEAA